MNATITDKWLEARRSCAETILREAENTLRSVRMTASHNPAIEWQQELQRCEENVRAAKEALAEFDRAEVSR